MVKRTVACILGAIFALTNPIPVIKLLITFNTNTCVILSTMNTKRLLVKSGGLTDALRSVSLLTVQQRDNGTRGVLTSSDNGGINR